MTAADFTLSNITTTSATAIGVGNYQGEVNITFAIIPQLNTKLITTNLNALLDNQESTIKQAIINNNSGLTAGDFTLSNITTTSATAIGVGRYQGTVNVTFTIIPQLNTKLKTTNLNALLDNQESTIKQAIITNNSGLTAGDFTLSNITTTSATAIGVGKYQGEVNITFAIIPQLNTKLITTNLNALLDNQESTIKQAIINNNSGLTAGDFTLSNITTTSAIAIGVGKYQGAVNVTFTIIPQLNTKLITTNLNALLDNQESTIKQAVINNNSGLTAVDFTLSNITTTSATAIGVGKYQGAVNVTFTIIPQLNTKLITTNLNALLDNQESTIKQAIINNNSGFTAADFTLSNITTTSATAIGVGRYQGTVNVTFTIIPQLNTKLITTNLNALLDNQESTIKQAIINNNSGLTDADFTLSNITTTSATATGVGNYQGEVNLTFAIPKKIVEIFKDFDPRYNSFYINPQTEQAIKNIDLVKKQVIDVMKKLYPNENFEYLNFDLYFIRSSNDTAGRFYSYNVKVSSINTDFYVGETFISNFSKQREWKIRY
ncbi:chitinase [Mesoplasma corruscae]|uniref:Chitinase n=1 Tax=Mesoplasma corruscae TaxID=216874 RepID=A0A2S5RFV6_9MOLU|nr:chitinase [Mesoplasma corruscae]